MRTLLQRLLPWGVGLFFAALYLSTLTGVHTFDALSYILSVDRKPLVGVLFPHHLAYGPISELVAWLGRWFGVQSGAALPMQVLNALAGAASVAVTAQMGLRLTDRVDLALLAALVPGLSFSFWYFSGETDVYALSTLMMVLAIDRVIRLAQAPQQRDAWWLGVWHSLALLFHQANIFLVVAAAGVWLAGVIQQRVSVSRQLRLWWPYPLTGVVLVGGAYIAAALAIGFPNGAAFQAWLTDYAQTGWWGVAGDRWQNLGLGLSDTVAQPGGALFGLLLLGLLVAHLRHVGFAHGWLVGSLVAWLGFHALFFIWWEPENVKFWLVCLPVVGLLLGLGLRRTRRWGGTVWYGLGVLAVMGLSNYAALVQRGDPATDLQRQIAGSVAQQLQPADFALVPDGMLELYLPYYHQHDNYQSINQALYDSGGNWEQACAQLQMRIEAALHAGAQVLIADEAFASSRLLQERFQLDQPRLMACFGRYQELRQVVRLIDQAPAFWRLPTGQELAVARGWQFATFAEGWQAAHVRQSQIQQGWQFVPERDPALISPLLQLPAAQVAAVEIRLAHTVQLNDAQLFYAGPDQQVDEARSVRWSLNQTGELTTYRIELADAPGWQGMITRLRIDPVSVGDGGWIRIESIRLIWR